MNDCYSIFFSLYFVSIQHFTTIVRVSVSSIYRDTRTMILLIVQPRLKSNQPNTSRITYLHDIECDLK